jgi:hypothetical protein
MIIAELQIENRFLTGVIGRVVLKVAFERNHPFFRSMKQGQAKRKKPRLKRRGLEDACGSQKKLMKAGMKVGKAFLPSQHYVLLPGNDDLLMSRW